jgi:hypothetical protein
LVERPKDDSDRPSVIDRIADALEGLDDESYRIAEMAEVLSECIVDLGREAKAFRTLPVSD